jgi:hypothetical protein
LVRSLEPELESGPVELVGGVPVGPLVGPAEMPGVPVGAALDGFVQLARKARASGARSGARGR